MKNLFRILKRVLRYPAALIASAVFSLLVAAAWGANIGALYPVIEVTFSGESLQQWMQDQITDGETKSAELDVQIAALREQLAAAPVEEQPAREKELQSLVGRRDAELAALARSRYWQPYCERYLPGTPFRAVLLIIAVLLVSMVFKHICLLANTQITAWLINRVTMDLRQEYFEHILRMDSRTMSRDGTSRLLTLFDSATQGVSACLSQIVGSGIREPMKVVACLIGAAVISWRLLLLTLIITPAALYLFQLLTKSLRRAVRRSIEGNVDLNRCAFEVFNGLSAVQAYTREPYESGKLRKLSHSYTRKVMRIALLNSLIKPAVEIFAVTVVSLGLLAVAYIVLNQETHVLGIKLCNRPLSLASLIIFYAMLVGTTDPLKKMTDVQSGIMLGLGAADQLYQVLDQPAAIRDPAEPRALPKPHRQLVFERVQFSYHPDQPVLNEIDLSIPFGETLAIVGPNGCGKTTLVNLVPRFYDPTHGGVKLDGIDLREASLRDLRRKIGIVTQQTLLFDDTVLNNIRYGDPDASEERVVAAAKMARAHDFITTQLAKGYQTVVGQGGGRLSGGQRQRIALARAILRDPEILILDEATSQIDLHSENLIQQAMAEFVRGRTTIIIAHRLSTLSLADRILVMRSGRVIDLGSHDELATRCAFYNDLRKFELKKSA